MMNEGYSRFLLPTLIIVTLAIFVSFGFKKLKRLASVCKVK
jgi:hypothetical protein